MESELAPGSRRPLRRATRHADPPSFDSGARATLALPCVPSRPRYSRSGLAYTHFILLRLCHHSLACPLARRSRRALSSEPRLCARLVLPRRSSLLTSSGGLQLCENCFVCAHLLAMSSFAPEPRGSQAAVEASYFACCAHSRFYRLNSHDHAAPLIDRFSLPSHFAAVQGLAA